MNAPNDVAEVMIFLWTVAEQVDFSDRTNCDSVDDVRLSQIERALSQNDGGKAAKALLDYFGGIGEVNKDRCAEILAMMRCIDQRFLLIHPRSIQVPSRLSHKIEIADWLERLRIYRAQCGEYGSFNGRRLVPRGPLVRRHREEDAGYAESLGDSFCALGVTKKEYSLNGLPISIRQRVIWTDIARGVPGGGHANEAKVAIVPVAENKGDIDLVPRRGAKRDFLDFRLSSGINAPQRVVDVLQGCGQIDIAVAPEFTLKEEHVRDLSDRLMEAGDSLKFRLLVAGSGQTVEKKNGQSWNESVGLNQMGAYLFKQRKIWPAALDKNRAKALGALVEDYADRIYEDIASGNCVEVVDIESIGRCLVLICQDFKSDLAQELIVDFQPDWVFVPILDVGVDQGRWMHQRAFDLSEYSPARFVISCSASWAKQLGQDASLGMGLTSKNGDDDGSINRGVCLIPLSPAEKEHHVIDWSTALKWKQSKLTTA